MDHTPQPRIAWLAPVILGAALPGAALAQTTDAAQADAADLSPLVVTATRSRSLSGETPQRVTVVSREQLEQQLAITSDQGQILGNLIPGYSPSRQKMTNSGETFRGRTPLVMIDGVPQSTPLRDSQRDGYVIDLSMVERIEVIHGASAEHGLGATGGIINYVTKEPDGDTLSQHAGISLSTDDRFRSNGLGHRLNYRASGRQGDWDYLAGITQEQRGVFYDGRGQRVGIDNTQGEIQDSTSYNLLLKLGYWLDDDQNIEFSASHFDLENDGNYTMVPGDREAGIPTGSERGDPGGEPAYNRSTTARLAYSHADWFGNELDAQVYSQRFRARFGPSLAFPYLDDEGGTLYDQTRNESDKLGAKFTLNRTGLLDDRLGLTAGLDLLQDETQQALVQNDRAYVPETRFRNAAVFLQGDYDLTDRLTLQAGVRHEYAKLDVDTYRTIDRNNAALDGVTVEGGSPSFDETLYNVGLVYQATDWLQLYANYSEGFGMPDVGRVLRGITQPDQSVDELLDLAPIVTDNREIGTRIDWHPFSFEISYFESNSDLGQRLEVDPGGVYVASREKTEIQGVELSGEIAVNADHDLRLSYSHSRGKSDTDGDGSVDTRLTGINIAPDRLSLGWSARWNDSVATHLQYSHHFSRSFDDPDLTFSGYGLLDASLTHRLPVGRVSFGIENLLDEDYYTYYSQSARVADDQYFKGRGRTLMLGYQVDF